MRLVTDSERGIKRSFHVLLLDQRGITSVDTPRSTVPLSDGLPISEGTFHLEEICLSLQRGRMKI